SAVCFSSNASEMYLRKMSPRTTCLYSAASMLLRSLSAICQSFSSKPTTASDVEPFFVLAFFASGAASLAAAFGGRPRFLPVSLVAITSPTLAGLALRAINRATARLRVEPLVELGTLDAPLPSDLERRNLAGLRHGVDGLLRELEQRGDLLDGQDLVRHPGSRLGGA